MKCRSCLRSLVEGEKVYSLDKSDNFSLYTEASGLEIVPRKSSMSLKLCDECFSFCLSIRKFRARCVVSERIQRRELLKGNRPAFDIRKFIDEDCDLGVDAPDEDTYYIIKELDCLDEDFQKKYQNKTIVLSVEELMCIENKPDDRMSVADSANAMDCDDLPSAVDSPMVVISDSDDCHDNQTDVTSINIDESRKTKRKPVDPVALWQNDSDFEWPQDESDSELFKVTPVPPERAKPRFNECPECNKLLDYSDLQTHFKQLPKYEYLTENREYFSCQICNSYSTYNKCAYKKHIEIHAGTYGGYICSICGIIYAAPHEASHNFKRFECHICGKWIKIPCKKRHLETHNKNRKKVTFRCHICNKEVDVARKRYHFEIHSNIKRHKCTFCDHAFRTEADLLDHVDIHTKALRYTCRYCGEKMTRMQRRFHEKKCDKRDDQKSTPTEPQPSENKVEMLLKEDDVDELCDQTEIYDVNDSLLDSILEEGL